MALHLMLPASPNWTPPVLTCAGLTGEGLDLLWEQVLLHRRLLSDSGEIAARREEQRIRWMWSMLDDRLGAALRHHPAVAERLPVLEDQVRGETTTPVLAVEELISLFLEV